jgi:hypothetical protein
MKALDLVTMLRREKSVEIAYQMANKFHLRALAERIEVVRTAKFSKAKSIVLQEMQPLDCPQVVPPVVAVKPEPPRLVVPIEPVSYEEYLLTLSPTLLDHQY